MSARYLVLESATDAGSVAVIVEGNVVASLEFGARDPVTGARTEMLGRAVRQVLHDAGAAARDLAGVVCDAGPGSFTSLRCAAAIAKGICAAVGIPLYAVSSLELLAQSAAPLARGAYVAVLDAGRGEWFAADVEVVDGDESLSVGAVRLVSDPALRAHVAGLGARVIGRGEATDAVPRAAAVVRILDRVLATGPVVLDAWEPDYGRLAEAQVRWEAQHGRPLVG
jgi:tRNA threonylcarbamoyladenosine biosynthesis protein TsaB